MVSEPEAHADAGSLKMSHTWVLLALPHAAAARATVNASRPLHIVIVHCICAVSSSLRLRGHRWPDDQKLLRASRARTWPTAPSAHRFVASQLQLPPEDVHSYSSNM